MVRSKRKAKGKKKAKVKQRAKPREARKRKPTHTPRQSDRRMKYVNAGKVLPERLLKMVQKYCTGNIYIPKTRESRLKRQQRIVRHRRRGRKVETIAGWYRLSPRRVWQILAEARARK